MSQACVPGKLRLIEQNAHQLGDGQRRMRVVHLDGDPVRQRGPVGRPCLRKRPTMSCSEQRTMKYCCRKRSARPASVESSG